MRQEALLRAPDPAHGLLESNPGHDQLLTLPWLLTHVLKET